MAGRRLFTNAGPAGVFWRWRDAHYAVGIFPDPEASGFPIGLALPYSWVEDERGSIALFRLVLGKEELPGLWACLGREFLPESMTRSDVRGSGDW